MGCGVVRRCDLCYSGGMQKHPLWGVDTSKWTRAQHLKAWGLYLPVVVLTLIGAASLTVWLG